MLKTMFFRFFNVVKTTNKPKIHFFVKNGSNFLFSIYQIDKSRIVICSFKF